MTDDRDPPRQTDGTGGSPTRPSHKSFRGWLHYPLENRRFSSGLFTAAAVWSVIAGIGILLYTGFNLPKIGMALIAAFAAGAVGALVGFLFGVPMSRSDGRRETEAQDGSFKPNTNLEQVSDWITKIIVGLGLVQFRAIGAAVYAIGGSVGLAVAAPTSPQSSAVPFGIALIVGSSVVAFLLCYMWTTTRLYDVFVTGNEESRAVKRPRPEQPVTPQRPAASQDE
jgi:hypothetical protein